MRPKVGQVANLPKLKQPRQANSLSHFGQVSNLPHFRQANGLSHFGQVSNLPHFRQANSLSHFGQVSNLPHFRQANSLSHFGQVSNLPHFAALMFMLAAFAASPVLAQQTLELTPEAERAVGRALERLSRDQRPNGSWNDSTAETALAGLAFMVTGEIPGRGKYAHQSNRALQYILSNVEQNGLIIGRNRRSPMYHHGLATLYLTQAWGLTGYESIKPKLKKAVDLIITTQSAKGGWRYFPRPDDQDISVTVMQVVALRAARNCGIDVPDRTINNAIEYVRSLAHEDGGFGYQSKNDRGIARTGAGMFSLQVCGQYDDPRIAQGLDYLNQRGLFDDRWKYYGIYYLSASLYQIGGQVWDRNYPVIRDELVRTQRNDGSWAEETDKNAMAVLALAIPYRFLPIYQR